MQHLACRGGWPAQSMRHWAAEVATSSMLPASTASREMQAMGFLAVFSMCLCCAGS